METLSCVALLIAIETAFLVWLSANEETVTLPSVRINMLMISLFAPMLVGAGQFTTNIGNVFYSSVVCGQCILLELRGPTGARNSIPQVNMVMVIFFAMCWVLGRFPVLPGNEAFVDAARTVTHHSLKVVSASFVAFFLSQQIMIRSWVRLRRRHGPVVAALIASCACQAVDTPVFFTITFWGELPPAMIAEFASIGFLFKCVLAVAFVPAFVGAVYGPEVARRLYRDHAHVDRRI